MSRLFTFFCLGLVIGGLTMLKFRVELPREHDPVGSVRQLGKKLRAVKKVVAPVTSTPKAPKTLETVKTPKKLETGAYATKNQVVTIIVLSARENEEHRAIIRKTWQIGHTNVYFIVGKSFCKYPPLGRKSFTCEYNGKNIPKTVNDSYYKTQNEITQQLKLENDVVLVEMVDVYRNLATKLKLAYKWVYDNINPLPLYILKVDEDTFVRVGSLERWLSKRDPKVSNTYNIVAANFAGGSVVRSGKWAETKYKKSYYPPFPSGSGHLINLKLLKMIVNNFDKFVSYQGEDTSLGIFFDLMKTSSKMKIELETSPHFTSHSGDCMDKNKFVIGHDIKPSKMRECYNYMDELYSNNIQKSATSDTEPKDRKYLLFTSAGDKNNVKQWIGSDRNYDIAVVYYGKNQFSHQVDMLVSNKDTKFPNLYKWIIEKKIHLPDINKYNLVAVWDDDIVASVTDINNLFKEFDGNDASISSPCHTRGSYPSLFKYKENGIRNVDFVEMNAPIFKPDFLLSFMKNFDTNLKGYGTDTWFSQKCVNTCSIVVSDTTCVTNPKTRSDGTREIEKAQSEHDRSTFWKNLAKRRKLNPTVPPSAFERGYDKCPDNMKSHTVCTKVTEKNKEESISKTVVVTGAAGYIGSHTSLRLLEEGHTVVGIDNLSRGSTTALDVLRKFDNFRFYNIDLGDSQSLDKIIKKYKHARTVFHFAAVAFTLESVEFPELYKSNITLNTKILVDTMIQYKIPQLIYSSSCSVYGSPTEFPITEETNPSPVSPYGVAKLNAEKYIQKQVSAGKIRAHILRYFNVIGADPKGRLGENPRPNLSKYARLWTATMDTIFKRRKCVTLYDSTLDTPDGTAIRDYVHVSDLVDAHLSVLKYGFKNPVDIWNIGTGTGVSTKKFIKAAQEVSGKDIPICLETRKKSHSPPKLYASSKKLMDATGWEPTYTDVKSSLKTAWDVELKKRELLNKTTIILMGYNTKRIPNYKTVFKTYGSMTDVIDKIIFIWNNQNDLPPKIPNTDVYVQLVKGDKNLLTNRYKMSRYVTTSSVITVDDDVILPRNTILVMLKEYNKNPNLLIGLDDRSYTDDGKYIPRMTETTVNKLVIGKTMMWNKKYGDILFQHKDVVEYVNTVHPGCDDIAMNFLIKSITKKEPIRLLKVDRRNLPEIGGLSLKPGWYEIRNECVSFMLKYFKTNSNGNLIPKLQRLNNDINKHGGMEKAYGNVFSGDQTKQVFSYFKSVKTFLEDNPEAANICEIGFAGGHSATIFLSASENIENISYTGFDIWDRPFYEDSALKLVKEMFPTRQITVVKGDSTKTVASFERENFCDIIHVDGAHHAHYPTKDYENMYRLANKKNILLIDDCTNSWPAVLKGVDHMVSKGLVSKRPKQFIVKGWVHRGYQKGWCIGSYDKQ